jgi:hypothetical protein
MKTVKAATAAFLLAMSLDALANGHPDFAEHARPFGEAPVGGDHHAGMLAQGFKPSESVDGIQRPCQKLRFEWLFRGKGGTYS